MSAKIKVMLVDDSAVVRQVLIALLGKDSAIEVIASAPDPIFAMDKMNSNWPDVIVLDVEMPRMDGITFLKQIMSIRPTPVIICSTLTEKGAATSMQALAAGAVAIVTKPKAGLKNFLELDAGDIVQAVKAAAGANLRPLRGMSVAPTAPAKIKIDEVMPALQASLHNAMSVTTDKLVAIGTSTGGTQALEFVLTKLSRTAPGIVIVQHMPEKFTEAFADRLNKLCAMEVLEAKNGDRVIQGRALVAWWSPYAGKTQRCPISCRDFRCAASESASPFCRCIVPFGCQMCWQQCLGNHHDRHGRRWRIRYAGHA
jgi:two-component system chemotaxis response regulator CheB